jgi:hypothetical protein
MGYLEIRYNYLEFNLDKLLLFLQHKLFLFGEVEDVREGLIFLRATCLPDTIL